MKNYHITLTILLAAIPIWDAAAVQLRGGGRALVDDTEQNFGLLDIGQEDQALGSFPDEPSLFPEPSLDEPSLQDFMDIMSNDADLEPNLQQCCGSKGKLGCCNLAGCNCDGPCWNRGCKPKCNNGTRACPGTDGKYQIGRAHV